MRLRRQRTDWVWVGAEEASIRLGGHSHRYALRDSMDLLEAEARARVAVLDAGGRVVAASYHHAPAGNLHHWYDAPDDQYWHLLAAAGSATVIMWDGNQHNSDFLLSAAPLAVIGQRTNGEPVMGTQVTPYRMLKSHFSLSLNGLRDWLGAHSDPSTVLVAGTPPPKSEEHVRAGLAIEHYFIELLEKEGLTPNTVPLTDVATRVACWEALQEAMESISTAAGARFLAVPEVSQNSVGTLRAEYCGHDVTHGNLAYGVLMWQTISACVEGVERW
jgi:hypothetical protein